MLAYTWRWFVGAAFCTTLPSALLVVGWSYRLAQREVLRLWGNDYDRQLPNWFIRQGSVIAFAPSSIVHSLWQNLCIGFPAWISTWILTLPGCMLWLFSWYSGWNNSFFKGYEQALIGPITGLLGMVLFSATMLYIPMAQVRQASTMQWRSFYDFHIVHQLIRHRWLASLGLAAAYALISVPVMFLKTYPMFLPQNQPHILSLSDPELIEFLNNYFFYASLFVFPVYVALRIIAARIYAVGIIELLQSGKLNIEQFSQEERIALEQTNLSAVKRLPRKPWLLRAASWTASKTGRIVSTAIMLMLWAFFSFQILVSEFLNYHPFIGFLNQPLIHAPYFSYIPSQLKESADNNRDKSD